MINNRLRSIILVAISFILIAGCSIQKNPVSGKKRAFAYSWNEEVQIGQQADEEISAQFGIYDDEDLRNYVNDIGEEILAVSHLRRENTDEQFRATQFYFRVLDSPVINAFALPGGYVYMTRGLMAHLNNEAQFAVVMGHEIGHVAARHASQRALRQTWGQLAAVGGAIVGQEVLGLPGQDLLNLSSTAAQLIFLQYSRDAERESDELGVEYAAMNEYVASEGAEFFTSLKRLSDESGQELPGLLSTHPDPGEREQTIPELASQWEEEGYEQTELNQDGYMAIIDNMIYGENPRHGFERNGVFHHPDLAFRYSVPDNWELINQPASVVALSPEEDAVSMLAIDSESESPEQTVAQFTGQEGITVMESGSHSHGNTDWPAYTAIAGATLDDGTPVTLHIYAVGYDGNIYRFINYTLEDRFNSYFDRFEGITDSFQRESDSQILAIQPARLNVFRANRSGTFSSFIPDNLPEGVDSGELAILNQVEMDETISQGRWLKIPVQ